MEDANKATVFLLLGWGALITQPLALTFGKRPVYLITGVCHLVSLFEPRGQVSIHRPQGPGSPLTHMRPSLVAVPCARAPIA